MTLDTCVESRVPLTIEDDRTAGLDRAQAVIPLREPPTGLVAVKALFDELSGEV